MEYVKPFLLGGSMIAGTKYVSRFLNPALAPLVGGMPTGILAAFFLDSDKERRKYYDGYSYSSFVLFLVILFIRLVSNSTSYSVNATSGVGLALWAVVSYLVVKAFVKKA